MNNCEQTETRWMSVVEASEYFNQPVSTVIRRAGSGELNSRINEQGKIEIRADIAVAQEKPSPLEQFPRGGAADVRTPGDETMPAAGPQESSLAVAGAFQEARALILSYRDELSRIRECQQNEIRWLKISGRLAWGMVAAAVIVICWGIYMVSEKSSVLNGVEIERGHLRRDLADASARLNDSISRSERLDKKIGYLNDNRLELARALGRERKEHAATIGQLTAFQTRSAILSEELKKSRAEAERVMEREKESLAQVEDIRKKVNAAIKEQEKQHSEQMARVAEERKAKSREHNMKMASTHIPRAPRRSDPMNMDHLIRDLRRSDMRLSELKSAIMTNPREKR
jgi:hypothetical protein